MKGVVRHIVAIVLLGQAALALGSGNSVTRWRYLDATGSDAAAQVTTTHFDGLGRERMRVEIGAGGDGGDIAWRTDYDARGNVGRRWLPVPGGTDLLGMEAFESAAKRFYGDGGIVEKFGQRFDYDLWHRLVSSKAPGCGAVHYVYDRMGAVLLESTAEQRSRGEWTLTLRDGRGRPAVRGIVDMGSATRERLQERYGDSLMRAAFKSDYNKAETTLMYTAESAPHGFSPYMAWYYDDYEFIVGPNAAVRAEVATSASDGYTQRGLCTGTAQVDPKSGDTWYTATKYDHRGLPVLRSRWDLFLQQTRHTEAVTYDFVGNATERREKAELVVEATVLEEHEAVTRTAYDRQGRPVSRTVAVDGGPEVTLSGMEYDPVGRLARERGAVTTEYGYDIRSNLTTIRSERFAQTAWYGSSPAGGAVRYSGINVLRTAWFDGQDASGYYTVTETFAYDDLGRYRSTVSGGGDISEEVAVDLDGNVTEIRRTYKGDVVQDAIMEYEGGKVIAVMDVSSPYWAEEVAGFPAGDYGLTYDLDGRLKSDGTRGVSAISYYPFGNLPHCVQMENGDRMYSCYTPDGTLTRRQFTTRTVRTVTQITAGGDTIVAEYPQDKTVYRLYVGRFERAMGGGWTLLTEAGHYDLAEGRHYWHLRDRLGSTVAVVDARGGFRQTTAYYPSGTPRRLPGSALVTAVDAKTDRLHIGNRWLSHSGLGLYDNTARLHDPLLMRFATPDPLYADYPGLSPWSHCAADPLNRIDPTGERPTDLEGAFIAQHVYDGKRGDVLEGGWKMIDIYNDNDSKSFRAGLYSRTNKDGDIEYSLAFAGTFLDIDNIPQTSSSIKQDILQIFGKSKDMTLAINTAKEVSNELLDSELTILGHSKGGAEAVGASLVTGRDAITYNPAKINYTDIIPSDVKSRVVNYIVLREVVSLPTRFELLSKCFRQEYGYVGDLIIIQPTKSLNVLKNHSIQTVIDILSRRKK